MIERHGEWEICQMERTVRPTPDGEDPGGAAPCASSLWYRPVPIEKGGWIRSPFRCKAALLRYLKAGE